MNPQGDPQDPDNQMILNFNQDASSLCVGSSTGYQIFVFPNPEKLELMYEEKGEGNLDIRICERLFLSSLTVLVSQSSPRKLQIFHIKKRTLINNFTFSNTILSVRLNTHRLVVCLEDALYVHNMRDMKLLHTIRPTPPNPLGLCVLSRGPDTCLLAYPGQQTSGDVQVFDALRMENLITLSRAHAGPLAALAFDPEGSKLATASDKGTLIRVHNVKDGSVLFEFRRGLARCVTIYSLAFSQDARFLCASSNTETVHIFKLEQMNEAVQSPTTTSSWWETIGTTFMQTLPQVNQVFAQSRSFAQAKLPLGGGLGNVCAVIQDSDRTLILVATTDGFIYVYELNVQDGGECTLLKQTPLKEVTMEPDALDGDPYGHNMTYASVARPVASANLRSDRVTSTPASALSSSPSPSPSSPPRSGMMAMIGEGSPSFAPPSLWSTPGHDRRNDNEDQNND